MDRTEEQAIRSPMAAAWHVAFRESWKPAVCWPCFIMGCVLLITLDPAVVLDGRDSLGLVVTAVGQGYVVGFAIIMLIVAMTGDHASLSPDVERRRRHRRRSLLVVGGFVAFMLAALAVALVKPAW